MLQTITKYTILLQGFSGRIMGNLSHNSKPKQYQVSKYLMTTF
jgi:hypothetical protein